MSQQARCPEISTHCTSSSMQQAHLITDIEIDQRRKQPPRMPFRPFTRCPKKNIHQKRRVEFTDVSTQLPHGISRPYFPPSLCCAAIRHSTRCFALHLPLGICRYANQAKSPLSRNINTWSHGVWIPWFNHILFELSSALCLQWVSGLNFAGMGTVAACNACLLPANRADRKSTPFCSQMHTNANTSMPVIISVNCNKFWI